MSEKNIRKYIYQILFGETRYAAPSALKPINGVLYLDGKDLCHTRIDDDLGINMLISLSSRGTIIVDIRRCAHFKWLRQNLLQMPGRALEVDELLTNA